MSADDERTARSGTHARDGMKAGDQAPVPESLGAEPVWQALTPPSATLGEVPIFDRRSSSLFWIDLFAPALHRTDWLSGATTTWRLHAPIGSYALTQDPDLVLIGLEDGLFWLHLADGVTERCLEAPYDPADERFNDGRCDRAGRFWIGTIRKPDSQLPNGRGHFYRFDADGLRPAIDGVTVANGIAFAPDDRTMYLADRPNARILAYDYDLDRGIASNAREFVRLAPGDVPDGAAVDVDGGYWIAMFGGAELRRYAPDGRLDRRLPLPVSRPTMCAFAGPESDVLVVTTARWGLEPAALAGQPLAGSVLYARVGARGMTEPLLSSSVPLPPGARTCTE